LFFSVNISAIYQWKHLLPPPPLAAGENVRKPVFLQYTSCLRYNTSCTGRPYLGAKFGLADDFPPNIFPMTPPRNMNIGRGSRDLSESAKIRHYWKKSPANFDKKIKTTFLGHAYFPLLKLKMCFFVQESAAALPLFILCKNNFF
jgi:hypothetical protein